MCWRKVRQQGMKKQACTDTHAPDTLPRKTASYFRLHEHNIHQRHVSSSADSGHYDRHENRQRSRLSIRFKIIKRVSLPRVNTNRVVRIVDVRHKMSPVVPSDTTVGKNIVLATDPCWHFSRRPVTWHASRCTGGHGSYSSSLIGCPNGGSHQNEACDWSE